MVLLIEDTVVGDEVLDSPVGGVLLVYACAVDIVRIGIVDTCTSETATLGVTIVKTYIDAIAQAFYPWTLNLSKQGVLAPTSLAFA